MLRKRFHIYYLYMIRKVSRSSKNIPFFLLIRVFVFLIIVRNLFPPMLGEPMLVVMTAKALALLRSLSMMGSVLADDWCEGEIELGIRMLARLVGEADVGVTSVRLWWCRHDIGLC